MRISEAVWVGAFALAIVGCGEDRECGAGTVPMDGVCVPTSTIMCGAGTVMDANGDCVPAGEGTTCGAGTTLNAETGECEPDIECGTGTVAMSGECVPDGTVICDDGTMFDAETGTCVVRDGTGLCAEGTTLIDGECVPDDETLMADVFAAAEPDDPAFDGVPGSFVPPAIGSESTFEGCITAADFDGDDVTDIDLDFFTFSVAQAGLFRIHADGLGGAAAAFAIVAFDGPLADAGWIRMGLNYTGDSSERRVFIPRPGNYALVVFDSRSFVPSEGFVIPVGNADTCYFVTVEAEDIPAATPIVPGTPVMGTLGDPQFYSYTATGDQALQVIHTDDNPNAVGAAVAVAGALANAGAEGNIGQYPDSSFFFSPLIPDGTEALIVADYVLNLSLDSVGFEMTVDALESVEDTGSITLTYDEDDLLGQFAILEATAGEVIHILFDSADSLNVNLYPEDISAIYPICTGCTEGDAYFAADRTGAYLLQVINTAGVDGVDYTVDFTNRRQMPMTLTPGTPLDLTLVDTRTFVRVDTSAQLWTRYELSAFTDGMDPQLFTAANVDLHPDVAGRLPPLLCSNTCFYAGDGVCDDGGPGSTWDDCEFGSDCADCGGREATVDGEVAVDEWFGRIHGSDMGSAQLVSISDASGAFDMDESVTVSFDDEDFEDVIIDHLTPFAASVTVPAGGVAYYLVRGLPGGELTFEVSGTDGADPVIDVLDERVATIESLDDTGVDGVESFTSPIGAGQWFAFAIRISDSSEGTVNVGVSQTPPPYTTGPGTTVFSSICPGNGGAGEVVLEAADDGITPATDFTDFTGFEFFGAAVTQYRVDSNGWLTFASSASSDFSPDPLGTGSTPNNLVAPMWRDMVASEVCALEGAVQLTIEWNGTAYGPFGTMQMQAILTSSTGTIEFVYGPRHDLTALGLDGQVASVGIENADGSIGIPGADPAPGAATLFVPTTTP